MTDTALPPSRQALGVGNIVSESFSILFGNIVAVVTISAIPILIGLLVSSVFIGLRASLGFDDPNFLEPGVGFGFAMSTITNLVMYGVVIAGLVQLAYDAKLNRPHQIGKYFSAAIATIVPNIVQMIIISILAGLAMLALVLPGLWVIAVFSVVVPALVIERVGFGAMGRSSRLTKEYRWPIIGAFILVWICGMILNLVAVFVVAMVLGGAGFIGLIIAAIIQAVLFSLSYGLSSIATALIYARLREIKEGVSVDNLVAVFE